MNMRIIGIDCATQAARVGLALGRCTSRGLVIEDVRRGGKGDADPVAVVTEWVRDESGPVLLNCQTYRTYSEPLADPRRNDSTMTPPPPLRRPP